VIDKSPSVYIRICEAAHRAGPSARAISLRLVSNKLDIFYRLNYTQALRNGK